MLGNGTQSLRWGGPGFLPATRVTVGLITGLGWPAIAACADEGDAVAGTTRLATGTFAGSGSAPDAEDVTVVWPVLDVPDAFQIEIPDGWGSTSLDGREYTLSSGDDSELRINIVVYRARTKKDALPEVSTAAVREWAKSVGMQNSESLTVLTAGGATPRAFASIHGDRRDVFVGFFYFKKSFVVVAGTAPSDDRGGVERVERMLWSIEAA